MLKQAIVISGLTVAVICGAVTGIVGGAVTISLVADLLHIAVGG